MGSAARGTRCANVGWLALATAATWSCGDAAGPDPDPTPCDVRLEAGAPGILLEELTVTPCVVDLSAGDVTVVFRIRARAPASQVLAAVVVSESAAPEPNAPRCRSEEPVAGTVRDGTWECRWILNRYVRPGPWTVRAQVWGDASARDEARITLAVINTLEDATPPALQAIEHADEVKTMPWGRTRDLILRSADAEAGVWSADVGGYYASNPDRGGYDWTCTLFFGVWPAGPVPDPAVWEAEREFGFACPWDVVESDTAVLWSIDAVTVTDLRGNARTYDRAALEAGGFLTEFDVARRQ